MNKMLLLSKKHLRMEAETFMKTLKVFIILIELRSSHLLGT